MPPADLIRRPSIRLHGKVDDDMLDAFLSQLDALDDAQPALLEISTTGGDAETARRIATDIRLARERRAVSAFAPADRFLTRGTVLLVHERRLKKQLHLDGALRAVQPLLQDTLAGIESGLRLERAGFADLVAGTRLALDTLLDHVRERDWYVDADEALALGLVAATV